MAEWGRILLDAGGTVVAVDDDALELLGMPRSGGKAALLALQHGLAASGLLPNEDSGDLAYRRADVPGDVPMAVEATLCRAADGGWTLALRHVEQTRAWLGDSNDQVRFLSTFSHELRTPLTTLKTSLGLLAKKADGFSERDQDILAASQRNVDRLIGIITDVVDITSISSEELALEVADLAPGELMVEAVERVLGRVERDDIRVLESNERLPSVSADRGRLMRVLEELLENAAKCSEPGSGIDLSARIAGVEVEFAVRDRGRGLADEQLEQIFLPFHQVDMSVTRDVSGLGLGLPICKGIIEAHGGRLRVERAPDEGMVFSFTLPVGGS